MTRPFCIGLTGGIGSGKTAATEFFAEFGVPIIDADAISHEVVRAGQPALQEIVAAFGPEVVGDNGELRRSYLRKIVFNDAAARKNLESIIHPRVQSEIAIRIKQANYPYCIISSPLLVETRSMYDIDRIAVVDVPESLQIDRASQRDQSAAEDISKIVKSQINRHDRLNAADDVINNDKDLPYLRKQVESLHRMYLEIAAEKTSRCSL